MAYSDKVLDHYENPRNVGSFDKEDKNVGTGMVAACGDVMKLQIKVDDNNIITDACFKTYGCGSAINHLLYLLNGLKVKLLMRQKLKILILQKNCCMLRYIVCSSRRRIKIYCRFTR